jgi:hypothetical protein
MNINTTELATIAAIRQRDRDMYRVGGSNLQLREDIHTLLKHLDEVLTARAENSQNGEAA